MIDLRLPPWEERASSEGNCSVFLLPHGGTVKPLQEPPELFYINLVLFTTMLTLKTTGTIVATHCTSATSGRRTYLSGVRGSVIF